MAEELSQEEIFLNDVDPLDGIRALRKAEGVAEEDLPPANEDKSHPEPEAVVDGEDELDALEETPEPEGDPEPAPAEEEAPEPTAEGEDDGLQQVRESEEETPEGTSEKEVKPTQGEKLKFKANGQEFEFTPDEIVEQFGTVFGQAMDYTQKMQKIAPYRKMISALEEEGLTQAQLNLAIDALKGDKGALQKILKDHELETYDLEPDEDQQPYTPREYGKDEGTLAIEEVTSKIASDPEFQITVDVVDNQWDSNSRQAFAKNPQLIEGLHNDIKTGLYDQVAPRAMKMKVLDGNTKSDIEYYMLAGQQLTLEKQDSSKQTVDQVNQKTQAAVQNADQASSEAQRKRSASSTRTRADRKGVIDYLDDDDEAFDDWYKKLQASN